jgi:hypothetical protein
MLQRDMPWACHLISVPMIRPQSVYGRRAPPRCLPRWIAPRTEYGNHAGFERKVLDGVHWTYSVGVMVAAGGEGAVKPSP